MGESAPVLGANWSTLLVRKARARAAHPPNQSHRTQQTASKQSISSQQLNAESCSRIEPINHTEAVDKLAGRRWRFRFIEAGASTMSWQNLTTYPALAAALAAHKLEFHGWLSTSTLERSFAPPKPSPASSHGPV
jgi:hypothetical protein